MNAHAKITSDARFDAFSPILTRPGFSKIPCLDTSARLSSATPGTDKEYEYSPKRQP